MRKDRLYPVSAKPVSLIRRSALERLESRCVLSASPVMLAASLPPAAGHEVEMVRPQVLATNPHAGMVDQNSEALSPSRNAVNDAASENMPSFDAKQNDFSAYHGSGAALESTFVPNRFDGGSVFAGPAQFIMADAYGNHIEVIQIIIIAGDNSAANYAPGGRDSGSIAAISLPPIALHDASYGFVGAPELDPGSHMTAQHGADPVISNIHASIAESPTPLASSQSAIATAHINLTAPSSAPVQIGSTLVRIVPVSHDRLAVHSLESAAGGLMLQSQHESNSTSDSSNVAQDSQSIAADHFKSTMLSAALSSMPATNDSEFPVAKASLVGIPIDLPGVERAVHTLMSEIETLGTKFSSWLDEAHLLPLAGAATAAALGAGAMYYARRRDMKNAERQDDEASSSWLFLRLQPHPGE